MKRFKAHVSLNFGLVVVFLTIFTVLPANAFAFSWPFAGGVSKRLKFLKRAPTRLWLKPARLSGWPIFPKASQKASALGMRVSPASLSTFV